MLIMMLLFRLFHLHFYIRFVSFLLDLPLTVSLLPLCLTIPLRFSIKYSLNPFSSCNGPCISRAQMANYCLNPISAVFNILILPFSLYPLQNLFSFPFFFFRSVPNKSKGKCNRLVCLHFLLECNFFIFYFLIIF